MKLKQRAIKKLIEDIENISSGNLEYLGHNVISCKENNSLVHRGLNENGRPAKSTVDTFSTSGKVVGEYSVDYKYFVPKVIEDETSKVKKYIFEKIENDIKHAMDLYSGLGKLFLLSSQQCSNSNFSRAIEFANSQKNGTEFEITILDNRQIAEEVYDLVIIKGKDIEYFETFLPHLKSLRAEYALSNQLPNLSDDNINFESRNDKLKESFLSSNILVVRGVSGLGKSYTAINYAHKYKSDFDNVYWIDGADIKSATNLSSHEIKGFGTSINLVGRLNNSNSLLIVDNYNESPEELIDNLKLENANSEVLITSLNVYQDSDKYNTLDLVEITKDEAKKILTLNCSKVLSDIIFDKIFQTVGGYPLALAIMREMVVAEDCSWDDISEDLDSIPEACETKGETVLERLLLRHRASLEKELEALKYLDSKYIDIQLLKELLNFGSVTKLKKRSIIGFDYRGVVVLHDIIISCLKGLSVDIPDEIAVKFWQYFSKNCFIAPNHFWRSLHFHLDLIESTAIKLKKPGLESYIYFKSDDSYNEDFIKVILEYDYDSCSDEHFALLSLIEAMELNYRNVRYTLNRSYNELLEKYLKILSARLEVINPVNKLHTDLLHHRGKFNNLLRKTDDAVDDFKSVLAKDATAYHAKLQLARILIRSQKAEEIEEAKVFVKEIIEAYKADQQSVGYPIVLEAFVLLGNKKLKELLDKYVIDDPSFFGNTILECVVEGFSHPYKVLTLLGQKLYYKNPDVVLQLFEQVFIPDSDTVEDSELFNSGQFYKIVGRAYQSKNESENFKENIQKSLDYLRKIKPEKLNTFSRSQIAEALVLAEEFSEAVELLVAIPEEEKNEHVLHRISQAYFGLDKFEESLNSINLAIEKINNKGTYLSTFLHVKGRILFKLESFDQAIVALEQSLDSCEEGPYKDEIQLLLIDSKKALVNKNE